MVKQLFRRGWQNGGQILFSKQQSILSGALVIGLMISASAILGLIKKRLYASILTPGLELDVFFAAFRLPDLIFTLLIGGSLNAAFIPVFSQYINQHDQRKSWKFASSILNGVLVFLLLLAVALFIFADTFSTMIGSGFDPQQQVLLTRLMRILLVSPILLGVSSFLAGILQVFRHFLVSFFSPVAYNLGAIFGVIFLYPILGVEGLAWGILIGSLVHLVIQLPMLLKLGFKYSLVINYKDRFFQRILRLSWPQAIGVGIEQFRQLLLVGFISFFPVGSMSFFDLGQSLINLPISVLGISIAQASLPQLANLHAQKDDSTMMKTFASSFYQILFFVMPVMVILVILKIPMVRLVYGAGQFSWDDTTATAWVVAWLGIGIFAFALNHLMVRLFYALQDTRTPMIFALVGSIVSVVVAWLSLRGYLRDVQLTSTMVVSLKGVSGVAMGVTLGAITEFILLLIELSRRRLLQFKLFLATPFKIFLSGLIMAWVIRTPVKILDEIFIDTTRVVNLIILVWLVTSVGMMVYLLVIWFLGVRELQVVLKILLKIKDLQKNMIKYVKSAQIFSTGSDISSDGHIE